MSLAWKRTVQQGHLFTPFPSLHDELLDGVLGDIQSCNLIRIVPNALYCRRHC
jgi:hypothetical protein